MRGRAEGRRSVDAGHEDAIDEEGMGLARLFVMEEIKPEAHVVAAKSRVQIVPSA